MLVRWGMNRAHPRNPPPWHLLASAIAPAAALLVIGYFAFAAIAGPNGVLSYHDYARRLEQRRGELAAVNERRVELRHRMDLLDPRRGADPDFVDELVRRRTGQLREDEVVLPTR